MGADRRVYRRKEVRYDHSLAWAVFEMELQSGLKTVYFGRVYFASTSELDTVIVMERSLKPRKDWTIWAIVLRIESRIPYGKLGEASEVLV